MSKPEVNSVIATALPATSGIVLLTGHVSPWLIAGFIAIGVVSLAISLSYIKRYSVKR